MPVTFFNKVGPEVIVLIVIPVILIYIVILIPIVTFIPVVI